ncbi:hypothetical protein CVT25_011484 [Psilocybe cyanescens]|uniref:Cytochrome P450 monooxygenase pc-3 n=1 Tax=Psilocybe cyanescens TaxID=93625 RepID=A0A409XA49_PSICY|nr:hypothetical protein CVT25_011484 [Psilocybe cyanescens]
MSLPPGLTYLLGAFVHFGIPSTATYVLLNFAQERQVLPVNLPRWAIVSIAIAARPIIAIVSKYHSKWANKRAAVTNGAIIAPYVQESTFSIILELLESLRNGYPAEVLHRWNKEYGNVVNFELTNTPFILTNEPEHIKTILATQFDSFAKGSLFISQIDSLFGEGVFNSDGTFYSDLFGYLPGNLTVFGYRFHRAMTRPFFTRERISDFEIYDRNWNVSVKLARDRLAEGHSIDIQDLIARFTLDSASEFLFGGNVGSLSAGIPYHSSVSKKNTREFYNHPSTPFVKAFAEGLILSTKRLSMGPEWPLAEFTKDKVLPLRRIMDDFTDPLMRMALAKREQDLSSDKDATTDEKEESTLLSHLVNRTQDPKILKDELINLLVAGRDTTMCLLAFSVYMLAEHPDIEKRLRQEIYEKVGFTEAPKYEHMREMRFMRAFLNEVLRLYPPVPSNSRQTTKPVVLPAAGPGQKPVYVPRGTTCVYAVINMQRRTDLWGPDALKFDPDRFLDERVQKYLVPNPYIFCPFNAGPRICLGQQFAYHEASYYLVRLLQSFTDFTLDHGAAGNVPPPAHWKHGEGLKPTEKICPTAHLTLFIKGGLWVRMKELKPESSEV